MSLDTVPPEEYILVDSLQKIAQEFPEIKHVSVENTPAHFSGAQPPHVLLSTCCDYGVVEQAEHHPNADLEKFWYAIDWQGLAAERRHYFQLPIASCDPGACDPKHRYSIKVDRYTIRTFDSIPGEVRRWFCTNLNIKHPRAELIPFGLEHEGEGAKLLPKYAGRPKDAGRLLYVNFQDHTSERLSLKGHFAQFRDSWVTFRPTVGLPVGAFLNEMASHKFVLCPQGNGIDCYRTYESIYLGCVPVLEKSTFSLALANAGLPVLVVNDLYSLTRSLLESVWPEMSDATRRFNYEWVTKSYWRARFAAEAAGLRQLP